MNQSSSGFILHKSKIGKNPCYLLTSDEAFSSVRYKMMQGILESGLLSCAAYHYNGKPKLMYMAEKKRPLSSLGIIDETRLMQLIGKIVDVSEQLSAPGFFNLENIELGMSDIYVDMDDMECAFIFLPLNNGGEGDGREQFKAGIMSVLRTLILDHSNSTSAGMRILLAECSRDNTDIQKIRRVLQMERLNEPSAAERPRGGLTTGQQLRLVGVGTPVDVSITINKPEFVIGKSVNGVDGTISFNPAISRVHCKIIQNGMRMYISDLGSSNGTFVNGQRIQGGQMIPIAIGDKIKLANSIFELREG